jgi:hypothetical protein
MTELKVAPSGFTRETWRIFSEQGYLVVPGALSVAQAEQLRSVIQSFIGFRPAEGFDEVHIVEKHPAFADLIDHCAHIGYVYDLYGEASKLLLSQFFVRPPLQSVRNDWHFDGPRQVPFSAFSPRLPLRLKVGYWLTELASERMGNLLVLPGSHHCEFLDQYKTHDRHPDQMAITARPGDMILMAAGLWHRVDVNESENTRINVFYEYGPSWITTSDHWRCHPLFLERLTREQRILMRDYEYPNGQIKLPAEDYPLFADARPVVGQYSEHVPMHLRKHPTRSEEGFV